MANTFSALVPILYGDQQIVARELTGAIQSVSTAFGSEGAALNQTVRVPIVPTIAISTYTPGMTTTSGADMAEAFADLVITNNYKADFNLTGEQMQFLMNNRNDVEYVSWLRQAFQQAIRTVMNQIEVDLCTSIYKSASRAVGTAGTTPFATTLTAAALTRQILDDNGAPAGDRSLIIGTNAGVNLRSLTQLNQVYAAGTDAVLVDGALINLFGLKIKESAQVLTIAAKGTGTSYTSATTGFPIGTTQIPIITGTGTVLAGDTVTFTGDTNVYIVAVGVAAPGTITLGGYGLRKALAASAVAMTIGNVYTANFALQRSAVAAVIRPPFIPASPMIRTYPIRDEKTGLTLTVCEVMGDGMITYRVHAVTGYKVVQGANIAILMG